MALPPSIRQLDRLVDRRSVRVVLAVVLISLIAYYPGAMASPYEDPGFEGYYDNRIVEQASDVESIKHERVTGETPVYQYTELSPVAQEVFDKTRAAETNSFTIRICKDWVLTCDAYHESEIPEEFQYGAVGHNVDRSELYRVVEYEDEAYVLQTGALGHGDSFGLGAILSVVGESLLVLAVSGVLVHNTIRPPETDSNEVASIDIALSVFIGVVALAAPYLHMWDVLTVAWSRLIIAGAIVVGIPVYYLRFR